MELKYIEVPIAIHTSFKFKIHVHFLQHWVFSETFGYDRNYKHAIYAMKAWQILLHWDMSKISVKHVRIPDQEFLDSDGREIFFKNPAQWPTII